VGAGPPRYIPIEHNSPDLNSEVDFSSPLKTYDSHGGYSASRGGDSHNTPPPTLVGDSSDNDSIVSELPTVDYKPGAMVNVVANNHPVVFSAVPSTDPVVSSDDGAGSGMVGDSSSARYSAPIYSAPVGAGGMVTVVGHPDTVNVSDTVNVVVAPPRIQTLVYPVGAPVSPRLIPIALPPSVDADNPRFTPMPSIFKRELIGFCDSDYVGRSTAPYSLSSNGKAERINRTLMDKERAMNAHAGTPANLCPERFDLTIIGID
jgi:hypothetical protein